ALTGHSYDTAFQQAESIDSYIAKRISVQTKLPRLLLGWQAAGSNQFWSNHQIVAPIDSPLNGWQTAFGSGSGSGGGSAGGGGTPAQGPAFPRKDILDLVAKQVKRLQGQVGAEGKNHLDAHLASLAQLQTSINAPTTGSCMAPGM